MWRRIFLCECHPLCFEMEDFMYEQLSLYHIFQAVAESGNISQAAKTLYISQPAVSRAIQKLEANLDTQLFKRSSRGVFLTADGRILFDKIKAAFELVAEGEDLIIHNSSRKIPHLRLGTSTTLCRYVLLSRLKPYISRALKNFHFFLSGSFSFILFSNLYLGKS